MKQKMKINISAKTALEQSKKLLLDCEYKEVIELLKNLKLSSLKPFERGEYHLLMGECLLYLGNYDHSHFHEAIKIFKNSSLHVLFGKAKYLLGWQLQSLVCVGRNPLAVPPLLEIV